MQPIDTIHGGGGRVRMASLHLALLGPLRLIVRGQTVQNFGYNKVAALLAYLAVEPGPHARDTLAALLWPESSDEAARRSLRVALTHLRRAINDQQMYPSTLLVTRDTIAFNTATDYSLDILQFTTLVAADAQHADAQHPLYPMYMQRIAQAVKLYRGDFLADLRLNDSHTFEEWASLRRERLHQHMVYALGLLLAYHEQRGDDTLAYQYAWRSVELEPWDEAAHRCLIRVLLRRGQSGAALVQYKRCSRTLADEFGIAPTVETTALYESISRSESISRLV
jgi:DNA-binding SARP family transcriptional activator